MAEYLYQCLDGARPFFNAAGFDPAPATHVAWPVDDLPGLAADIHRTVADLLLHGPGGDAIDAAILDRLRGATPSAADDAALPG